ncbi:MAG TPA: sporulation protein YabP [Bacillota bacterium]|nr:sporulation protein YabP [Peptococcaceae bacterium MAG4]NLW37199.1 sporulation protein YabP [Peptococcaceae bacterium]HPZ42916.1 sporulation protein YabP [Bacillota bacterium]HQD75531.1 sporulation protein YabP [Bacillota bacterium]HUM58329.1 sporulation protein YabP [Bacillota bacterium]
MEEDLRHSISVSGRKRLVMEGVLNVDSFDESEIRLETNMGLLVLKGEGLHITHLSLEQGNLAAEGFFTSLQYHDSKEKGKAKAKGMLSRILK